MNKKEVFSIPNCMSYFRVLLIPFIIWTFLSANSKEDYIAVGVLVVISGLTDLLDGKIARKFNMITELGKFLDPVADKLTLGALVICMAMKHSYFAFAAVLYVLKEGFMGGIGLIMFRKKQKKLDGAMWFGKVCTALLYLIMFIMILFGSISEFVVMVSVVASIIVMIFTLTMYIPVFIKMWKE